MILCFSTDMYFYMQFLKFQMGDKNRAKISEFYSVKIVFFRSFVFLVNYILDFRSSRQKHVNLIYLFKPIYSSEKQLIILM